ncbi:MAG: SGNH/GDSL hydrolase family protein [Planctomycetota bacterium]
MSETKSKLSLKKKLFFSAIVTALFFGVAELGFRALEIAWPPRHVDFGLGFNDDSRVFVESSPQSGYMETDVAKRVSFVRQRYAREKPSGVFRIVALGGSSVNYLEPEFKALERKLTTEFDTFDQVEIINCGGFAYGSHRLVIVMREMLEYEPDLILLYTGHNEFEEVEQLSLSGLQRLSFERTISQSAIVRFMRDRKTEYEIDRLEKEHNQRVLAQEEPVSGENFARAWSHEFREEDVRDRMQKYQHNLNLILTAAKNENIAVIMGTVSSNLLQPYLPRDAAVRYEQVYELWKGGSAEEGLKLAKQILAETVGRHQCSDLENGILKELAAEFSLPIVDVETMVMSQEPHGIPGETLFDDHCHLNDAGRAVWINGYTPEIRKIIQASLENDG